MKSVSLISGYTIFKYNEVSSTMHTARNLNSFLFDGAVVSAQKQTNGRGKSKNIWHSPDGNIYMTIAVKTNHPQHFVFLSALAVGELIILPNLQYKWPNDILIGNKKICGILIENFKDFTLIGIGLNTKTSPLKTSTALSLHTHIDEFLDLKIINNFEHYRKSLEQYGFEYIRKIWLERSNSGSQIQIKTQNTIKFGKFISIDHDGSLLLEIPGEKNLSKIYSGEIFNE